MSGKLVVGQAGGATAVINASLTGVIRAARSSDKVDAIWGMRRGAEGALQSDFVDLGSVPDAALQRLTHTPGAALGSSRHKVTDDDLQTLLTIFERNNVRYLLYIGGNDSADTVHRLASMAQAQGQTCGAIAVPKTID